MLNPEGALEWRDLLVDVATAGDFGTYRRPQAAKISFTIWSYADPERSPIADQLVGDDGRGSSQYEALLPVLESMLDDTESFGPYWGDEWAVMLKSKTAMVMGEVELREIPHVDLAVATTPEPLHRMVLYKSTERLRVLTALPGGHYRLRYRYESWVQVASQDVMPRVDLNPLLPRLQELEQEAVQWRFGGNDWSTPDLEPIGSDGQPAASSLTLEELVDELVAYYEREQENPALQWNPYK
jgi:hypothetical protein